MKPKSQRRYDSDDLALAVKLVARNTGGDTGACSTMTESPDITDKRIRDVPVKKRQRPDDKHRYKGRLTQKRRGRSRKNRPREIGNVAQTSIDWIREFGGRMHTISGELSEGSSKTLEMPEKPDTRVEADWAHARFFSKEFRETQIEADEQQVLKSLARNAECFEGLNENPQGITAEVLAESLSDVYLQSDAIDEILTSYNANTIGTEDVLTTSVQSSILHDLLAQALHRNTDAALSRGDIKGTTQEFPDLKCNPNMQENRGFNDVEIKIQRWSASKSKIEPVTISPDPGQYIRAMHHRPDSDDAFVQGLLHADGSAPDSFYNVERYYIHQDTIAALKETGEIKKDDKNIPLSNLGIPVVMYDNPLLNPKTHEETGLTLQDRRLWTWIYNGLSTTSNEAGRTCKLAFKTAAEAMRLAETTGKTAKEITTQMFANASEIRTRTKALIRRFKALGMQISITETQGIEEWGINKDLLIQIDEHTAKQWKQFFQGSALDKLNMLEEMAEIRRKAQGEGKQGTDTPDLSSKQAVNEWLTKMNSTPALYILSEVLGNTKTGETYSIPKIFGTKIEPNLSSSTFFGPNGLPTLLDYRLIVLDPRKNTIKINTNVRRADLNEFIQTHQETLNAWHAHRHKDTPDTLDGAETWAACRDAALETRLTFGPPHLPPYLFHVVRFFADHFKENGIETMNYKTARSLASTQLLGGTRIDTTETHMLRRRSLISIKNVGKNNWEMRLLPSVEELTAMLETSKSIPQSEIHEETMVKFTLQDMAHGRTHVRTFKLNPAQETKYEAFLTQWRNARSIRIITRLRGIPRTHRRKAIQVLNLFQKEGVTCLPAQTFENEGIDMPEQMQSPGFPHIQALARLAILYQDQFTKFWYLSHSVQDSRKPENAQCELLSQAIKVLDATHTENGEIEDTKDIPLDLEPVTENEGKALQHIKQLRRATEIDEIAYTVSQQIGVKPQSARKYVNNLARKGWVNKGDGKKPNSVITAYYATDEGFITL